MFHTGFRSSRKFQKKLFVWDLLERVHEQLVANEGAQPTTVDVGVVRSTSADRVSSSSPDPEMHCRQMFLNAISRINSNNLNIGKDEKVSLSGVCTKGGVHSLFSLIYCVGYAFLLPGSKVRSVSVSRLFVYGNLNWVV